MISVIATAVFGLIVFVAAVVGFVLVIEFFDVIAATICLIGLAGVFLWSITVGAYKVGCYALGLFH